MTTNPDHFRPRDAAGSLQYLDGTIRTASPARLRLMLIERAIDVSAVLAERWRTKESLGANEQSLKLLDLLNELLGGVTGGTTTRENSVCQTVSDLYVFLIQHLIAAEEKSDVSSIDEIRIVLETEAGTWRAVSAGEVTAVESATKSGTTDDSAPFGLNFEA